MNDGPTQSNHSPSAARKSAGREISRLIKLAGFGSQKEFANAVSEQLSGDMRFNDKKVSEIVTGRKALKGDLLHAFATLLKVDTDHLASLEEKYSFRSYASDLSTRPSKSDILEVDGHTLKIPRNMGSEEFKYVIDTFVSYAMTHSKNESA